MSFSRLAYVFVLLAALLGLGLLRLAAPTLSREQAHASIRALRPDWRWAEDRAMVPPGRARPRPAVDQAGGAR